MLSDTAQNEDATNVVYGTALNDRTSLNQLYQMIEEYLIERVAWLQKKSILWGFWGEDVQCSQAEIDELGIIQGIKLQRVVMKQLVGT